jgi:hypothetical protein
MLYIHAALPPPSWPDPALTFFAFGERRQVPEVGGLLLFGSRAVESLYYLADLDARDDLSTNTIDGHAPDVVDVAHARWATGACVTAIDVCAAALARAYGYTGKQQLALGGLKPDKKLRSSLPPLASAWADAVFADPEYKVVVEARHALTHSLLIRHFSAPRKRLRLSLSTGEVHVPALIEHARSVGERHLLALVAILPQL